LNKIKHITLFWHRRDLRLEDNAGLFYALKKEKNVVPIFIFDRRILDQLSNKKDARVQFIYTYIAQLKKQYQQYGSDLTVYYGEPSDIFKALLKEKHITSVYTNHDYEKYAIERDTKIKSILSTKGIPLHTFKDQVIFEKNEITKNDGKPYTIFTPYSKKWKAALTTKDYKSFPTLDHKNNLLKASPQKLISLEEMGFDTLKQSYPSTQVDDHILNNYHNTRDIPSIKGTSRLSIHLRFGTVSIRSLVNKALQTNEIWLNELIWRDFYMGNINYHFPHTAEKSFKPAYDQIPWINNEDHFNAWCQGKTGYPIVDAGMRELNTTGFMHNRVRMITASFLIKHLLIDWRWGEAYFAEKLLDFEQSSNNGGWQWAASSGCDAAPYFRVFNPTLQMKKFDPNYIYIKKWIPEFEDPFTYPKPIVDHTFARERVIRVYKETLKNNTSN